MKVISGQGCFDIKVGYSEDSFDITKKWGHKYENLENIQINREVAKQLIEVLKEFVDENN